MAYFVPNRKFSLIIVGLVWLILPTLAHTQSSAPTAILRQNMGGEASPDGIWLVSVIGQSNERIALSQNLDWVSLAESEVVMQNGERHYFKTSLTPTNAPLEPFIADAPSLDANREATFAEIEAATGKTISPIFGPYSQADVIWMSGEADNFVNFYLLQDAELLQITQVQTFFEDAAEPLLSASVELLQFLPHHNSFLYRARVLDAAGTDFNRLYRYDFASGQNIEMPYFGKTPVFSPDEHWLAGSRLSELPDGRPIYELWLVEVDTGIEEKIAQGCNPHWAEDSTWLGYDLHDNPLWQGYVDCFANGQVAAYNIRTQEKMLLTEGMDGYVQIIGWLP